MNNLKTGILKFFCTLISAIVPVKSWRHKVRYALNPLNDRRCTAYFTRKYAALPYNGFSVKALCTLPPATECLWLCWLQGEQQMPELVKNCVRSVEKHKNKDQRIFIITEENYGRYISLPDFIIKKRERGAIGNAHFSDILRVYLLAAYGGYWIDATCLMTDAFPEGMSRLPFFMYHSQGEFAYTMIQNCFIHAKKSNYLITRWAQLTTELWHNEDRLRHYFQHHLMFKAMISSDDRARKEYEAMPYANEKDTHTIQEWMKERKAFSPELLEKAMGKSFIHKLTYKLAADNHDGTETFTGYFSRPKLCLPQAKQHSLTFSSAAPR